LYFVTRKLSVMYVRFRCAASTCVEVLSACPRALPSSSPDSVAFNLNAACASSRREPLLRQSVILSYSGSILCFLTSSHTSLCGCAPLHSRCRPEREKRARQRALACGSGKCELRQLGADAVARAGRPEEMVGRKVV
jgi:hypothetical protein